MTADVLSGGEGIVCLFCDGSIDAISKAVFEALLRERLGALAEYLLIAPHFATGRALQTRSRL